MRRAWLCWPLWIGSALCPPRAGAETYAVERPLDGEADLLALGEDGALPPEEVEALRELLRTGVAWRTASREALYALPGLTWAQVDAVLALRETRPGAELPDEALVEAGVLTPAQLHRLRPFLAARPREAALGSGRLRLLSAYGVGDATVPPVLLQARAVGPWGVRAGVVATLTRRRLGAVAHDPRRRGLVAAGPGVTAHLPAWHVRWEGERGALLVGAYRLGFGQRLTLDTTGRPAPDGFVPDEDFTPPGAPERRCVLSGPGTCEAPEDAGRVTPDFGWTEGFRGVVGTVHARGEALTLAVTGFGSFQSRSLSSSELFDRARCAPASRGCEAPDVLAVLPRGTARFVSRPLPDAFLERAGGGHVRLGFSPRAHVGMTAWRAVPSWTLAGLRPDFRPQSRYPAGGGYGALGVDAAWGRGPVDLGLEGAWSFTAAGGGLGVLQRVVVGDRARQLEGSLRYYGRGFENPHARPLSSADESGGLRASNEVGARLRYLHRTADGAWRGVGQVDLWTQPADDEPRHVHLTGSARVEALDVPPVRPSLWVEHHDKDLARNGPGLCFEGTEGTLPGGVAAPCPGERSSVGARVAFEPGEAVRLAAQVQHVWMGSRQHAVGVRRDARAHLEALLRPGPSLRLEGRVGWRDEDLADDTRGARSVQASVSAAWWASATTALHGRYALVLERDVPPQHLFRLELDARF